jgi:ketosteroid isomerase-like protein
MHILHIKKLTVILGPLLICIFIFLSCQSAEKKDDLTQSLFQTDRDFAQMSLEKGMAEAFNHYLAEDAILIRASGEPLVGREIIFNAMKASNGHIILTWEPQKAGVAESGDMGYTWGIYTSTAQDQKGKTVTHGKYLNVWKRQTDGSWKLYIDIGNVDPTR